MAYNVFTSLGQNRLKFQPGIRLPSKSAPGFALVSVLMLAVLLTLVVVALFSLLNVETQSGGNVALRNQARQNAITALDLALAEAQKNLGPDQRVSAPASLLDSDRATPAIEGVVQPHWIGAWKSVAWNTSATAATPTPPDYTVKYTKSKNTFLRWLVSSPEDKIGSPSTAGTDVRDPNLPKNPAMTDSNSIVLVGAGTVQPPTSGTLADVQVRAWKITGDTYTQDRVGSYAWWVGDEGLKAKVNVISPLPNAPSEGELQAALANAPRTALEAVATFSSATTSSANLAKTVTYSTLPLAYANGDFTKAYYDYTVSSKGVLSDTQNGGLKKDLNLLLELPESSLPTTIKNGAVWQKIFSRTYPAGNAMGPDWGLVYRYYNLYKSPYLSKDTDGTYVFYTDRYNVAREAAGDRDFVTFQTLRIQYLFGFAAMPGEKKMPALPAPQVLTPSYEVGMPDGNLLYLTCYPVLQVWNPYNVRLRSSTAAENSSFSSSSGKASAHVWSWPGPNLSISFDGGPFRPFLAGNTANGIFDPYGGSMWTTWIMSGNYFQFQINPGAIRLFGIEQHTGANARKEMFWTEHLDGSRPDRAFNLLDGFNSSNLPPHSNYLLNAGDNHRIVNPTTLNFQVKFNTDLLSKAALSHNVFGEGGPIKKMVGFAEINTLALNTPPPADTAVSYKTLVSPGDIPAVTPSTDINTPNMAFSYTINYKAFPKDFLRKSKSNLFSDPLEKNFIIVGADAAVAQMAPLEMILQPIQGNASSSISNYPSGIKTVQVDSTMKNGYFGDQSDNITSQIAVEFPTAALTSLVQLAEVPLGRDYTHPIYLADDFFSGYNKTTPKIEPQGATFFRALANSYAHPAIDPVGLVGKAGGAGKANLTRSMDHAFFANYAFWDSYFFSGIAPEIPIVAYTGGASPSRPTPTRTAAQVLQDFLTQGAAHKPLPALRMIPWTSGKSTSDILKDLFSSDTPASATILDTAYTRSASWMMVDGAFNINSTSVDAWTAVLSGNLGQKVPYMPATNGTPFQKFLTAATSIPFPRFNLPNNTEATSGTPQTYWNGFRTLTVAQIRTLASKIVEQVKARGPFLSMAEFVNRQVSDNTALNQSGALQAAIDASNLNSDGPLNTTSIASGEVDSGLPNATAGQGSAAAGSNGYVLQGDILKPIANSLSPRSDTFVIRSYGDVATKNGKILSRAWCEAVIQRTPEYMDPTDLPNVAPTALKTMNQNFGRRFRIIQFRWLTPDEV